MSTVPLSRFHILTNWSIEGVRTSFFLSPRWNGLRTDPITIAVIIFVSILIAIGAQRLYIPGPAIFYWQAVAGGWIGTALAAWNCYLLRPDAPATPDSSAAPSAAHLFTMLISQGTMFGAISGCLFAVLIQTGLYTQEVLDAWVLWTIALIPWIWITMAQIFILWRGGDRHRSRMTIAAISVVSGIFILYFSGPPEFWYRDNQNESAKTDNYLRLTQQVMESQPVLLSQRLSEIRPRKDRTANMFVITFAPYGDDVFRRESEMVAKVMEQRFGAEGHVLQLVNNVETVSTWPWATTLNLRRAITRFAEVMDRENDILFIHLTSHGGRNGELAASFWPLEIEKLRPGELKEWLDESGIRNRVISVSACYSGSWLPDLSDENTVIMTAADAEHTSYGCGKNSELTFFGRAMYDEQIRNHTLSFEKGFRDARKNIEQREKEAGKADGFSNPQIRVGERIRTRLVDLQAALTTTEK